MNIRKLTLLVFVFVLSYSMRWAITDASLTQDFWIDLAIYMDGGRLLDQGINPYDYSDNVPFRDFLREYSRLNVAWVGEKQDRWNYYSSGNLPLSLVYYWAIGYITDWDPYGWRMANNVIDSILSVFIALFILCHWKIHSPFSFILAATAGILSPILLHVGTLYPEDKGLQILFMIAAIHFSLTRNFLLATLFLGLSIAFKGLGVFIAPLCLYYFSGSPDWTKIKDASVIKVAFFYTLSTCCFALLPFIYFLPDVISMITNRLDIGINADYPTHSSMWRWLYIWFPTHWKVIQVISTLFFILLNLLLILRKRMSAEIITSSILIWFVAITLITGSLDRLNIAFLTCVLMLGVKHLRSGLLFLLFYTFAGSLLFFNGYHAMNAHFDFETLDAAFSLMFFLLYLAMLLWQVTGNRNLTSLSIIE